MLSILKDNAKNIEVIYVEDNVEAREVTEKIFQRFMKNLKTAGDGVEGLELFRKRKEYIDLVITDISMPNMNGLDMLKEIKKINPRVHSVIISAHNDTQNLVEAIDLGVEHFILKPIEHEKMLDTINTVLSKIQREKELEHYRQQEVRKRLNKAMAVGYDTFFENIALPAVVLSKDDEIIACNTVFEEFVDTALDYAGMQSLKGTKFPSLLEDFAMNENSLVDWKIEAVQMHGGRIEGVRFRNCLEQAGYTISIKPSTLSQEDKEHYVLIICH